MAIGGYSYSPDEHLGGGIDPETGSKWFTIRMRFDADGVMREINSAAPAMYVPPEVLEQKLALLKITPVGVKVNRVGWRRTENIFYLRIYEEDVVLGEWK